MDDLVALRTTALRDVSKALESDSRFVAAWLAGSFGRGEADDYSDLDLVVVVANDAAATVCNADVPSRSGTTPARREIIAWAGTPVIVHEHHANASGGGSFTAVVYRSGLAIDWTFVPFSEAARGAATQLIFDSVGVPEALPTMMNAENLTQRLAERVAFFWLLAVPAAKAVRRGDSVKVHAMLEMMYRVIREVRGLLEGRQLPYTRRSLSPFYASRDQQRQGIQAVCDQMRALQGELAGRGVALPDRPERVVERWLNL